MWTADSFIKVQGRNVRLADLQDKVLFAGMANVPIYRSTLGTPVYRVPYGQSIGKLYSHFGDPNDPQKLWLYFFDSNGRRYFVPYTPGTLSLTQLTAQGVKPLPTSSEQAAEANKPKDFGEATYSVIKSVLFIGAGLVGYKIYQDGKTSKRR